MPPRRFLSRVWRRARGRGPVVTLDVAPDLPERDEARVREAITDVLGRLDTMTQRAEVAAIANAYLALDVRGRERFFRLLARDFWIEPEAVHAATDRFRAAGTPLERRAAEHALRETLEPPAGRLLRLFTGLDGGVKLLVDLRGDLLRFTSVDHELAQVDEELYTHLRTLFDVGLLTLHRITWDSPASLLEKLIEYEAVHAIDSWTDLKNRLDSDRRCYAFFHPAMPAEPLVFVEVALTSGIADDLPKLLDHTAPDLDPDRADTAVFYSISSCQPGLAGVNLGNALIKEVVEQLTADLPHLHRFVTLSPIPGFRGWLDTELSRRDALSERERELLPAEPARVRARLADEDWGHDEAIRPALLALCARYLTARVDGRAGDPVANFHYANGASLERLNWLADPSPSGRASSAGLMANYLYDPDRIAERAEHYVRQGDISYSGAIRELLAE
jgi:malonyl-CoA decarboxylase